MTAFLSPAVVCKRGARHDISYPGQGNRLTKRDVINCNKLIQKGEMHNVCCVANWALCN